MIRARRGEPLIKHIAVEVMRLVRQQFRQRPADNHDALMRPEGLVSGKEVDIRPQPPDISKAVGRIGHAVNADEGASGMGQRRDLGHRVDFPHHVGAMGKAD